MKLSYFTVLPGLFISTLSIYALEIDEIHLSCIDQVIQEAIENKQTPGAVVLVGHKEQIVYKKAFGYLSSQADTPMTVDTIFDLASLTKLFTATAILWLAQLGELRLSAPVSAYIPEFAQNILNNKDKVTVEHLLLHTSGLPAANPLYDYQQGKSAALENIYRLPLNAEPGTKYIYSDVGYIFLGQIVEKIAGKPLDVFIKKFITKPLGMHNTCFLPSQDKKQLIAPTELKEDKLLQGEVHDPRASLLGGIAGHAGLFSTADDLALFCQTIINKGTLKKRKILGPLAVAKMLTSHQLPNNNLRGLGWDIKTEHSTCIGDFFQTGTIAHTGFTGTAIIIEPTLEIFIIILTNRVNLKEGNVVNLRAAIANIVASSITL